MALVVYLREPTPTTMRVGWKLLKIQGVYGITKVADSKASTKWVSSFCSKDGSEANKGRRKEGNLFITYKGDLS